MIKKQRCSPQKRSRSSYQNCRNKTQGYDIGIKKDYDDIVSNLNKYSKQYHKISSLLEGNPTVQTPKNFKILKPSSLEEIGVFDKASIDEIKKALALSHQAFHSWSSVPVEKRAKVIEKFGDLLHENRYFFYSLLISESAKDIGETLLTDHRIAGVCFTGSTEVERTINRTLALPESVLLSH
ncbi:MAG: aldehyde dehydrogenase family protein [Candidatus Midichloria sp.]|nr:aldehyde dehydrogenase family protein [Candidatus Midichloria sp.]